MINPEVTTVVEFRLFVLDSLQHSSKAKSPNGRSAKQSSVGTLVPTHNQFFFFFFVFFYEGNTDIIAFLQ